PNLVTNSRIPDRRTSEVECPPEHPMGWLFRFLFKYPALLFQQGEFRFATSRPVAIGLLATAGITLAALVTYRTMIREQSLLGRSRHQRGGPAVRRHRVASGASA